MKPFKYKLPEFPKYRKRLCIFGTRKFNDFKLLKEKTDKFVKEFFDVIVISGEWRGIGYGTRDYIGADLLGEQWAHSYHYLVMRFPPNFRKYGRKSKAFHIRNQEMAEYATHAIAFWDGQSPGTKSMISLCKKNGVKLKVVRYDIIHAKRRKRCEAKALRERKREKRRLRKERKERKRRLLKKSHGSLSTTKKFVSGKKFKRLKKRKKRTKK